MSKQYNTDYPVIRPSIIDCVIKARKRLMDVDLIPSIIELNDIVNESLTTTTTTSNNNNTIEDRFKNFWLTEKDIPKLGKNIINYYDVKKGIEYYTDFISRYCLKGLFTYLTSNINSVDLSEWNNRLIMNDDIDITIPNDIKLLINDINLYNLNSNIDNNLIDSCRELSTITKHQLLVLIDEYTDKVQYDSLLFINKIDNNVINSDIISLLEEFQTRW
jgi:hypothetical protein